MTFNPLLFINFFWVNYCFEVIFLISFCFKSGFLPRGVISFVVTTLRPNVVIARLTCPSVIYTCSALLVGWFTPRCLTHLSRAISFAFFPTLAVVSDTSLSYAVVLLLVVVPLPLWDFVLYALTSCKFDLNTSLYLLPMAFSNSFPCQLHF